MCTMVLEGSYELGNNHYHERQAPRNRNGLVVIGVITFIVLVIIFLLSFFLIRCKHYSAKCVNDFNDGIPLLNRRFDNGPKPEVFVSTTIDGKETIEISFPSTSSGDIPSSTIDVSKVASSSTLGRRMNIASKVEDPSDTTMPISRPGVSPSSEAANLATSSNAASQLITTTTGPDSNLPSSKLPSPELATLSSTLQDVTTKTASNLTTIQPLITDDATITTAEYDNSSVSEANPLFHRNDHFLKCTEDPHICDSIRCKSSAGKMLVLMNHAADPCNDFYKYSCGGINLNGMELDRPEKRIQKTLNDFINSEYSIPHLNKFKKFHDSCSNYDSLSNSTLEMLIKVLDFFNKHGNKENREEDLTDFMGTLILHNPFEINQRLIPAFDIKLEPNEERKFIPLITLPLSMTFTAKSKDSDDFYEQNCLHETEKNLKQEENTGKIYEYFINCLTNNTLYITHLKQSLRIMKFSQNFPHLALGSYVEFLEKTAIPELGTITKLDILKNMRLKDEKVNIYKLEELSVLYPEIKWPQLFNRLFNTTAIDTVKLMYPEYIDKIFKFYKDHHLGEIKVTLMAILTHDLYIQYLKPQNPNERIMFCQKVVTNLMPDTMTNIYLTQYHKSDIIFMQERAKSIFNQIQTTLKSSIMSVSWLTAPEKNKLRNKIDELQLISKQDKFLDDQLLNLAYEDIEITENFLENIYNLKFYRRGHVFRAINKIADAGYIWSNIVSPISIDAVAIPNLKAIVAPISLISKYFHEKKFDPQDYEVFAKFANIITQRMFEIISIKNIQQSLSSGGSIFQDYIDDQLLNPDNYKQTYPFLLKFDINDLRLSLSSRFVDESALSLIQETYSNQETKDLPLTWLNVPIPRLFFLAYMQEYCEPVRTKINMAIELMESVVLPHYYRFNGAIQNSNEFAKIFECYPGTLMNASNKTKHFPRIS